MKETEAKIEEYKRNNAESIIRNEAKKARWIYFELLSSFKFKFRYKLTLLE